MPDSTGPERRRSATGQSAQGAGQLGVLSRDRLDAHSGCAQQLTNLVNVDVVVAKRLGGAVRIEVLPIRPYQAFADDLAELSDGVQLPQ